MSFDVVVGIVGATLLAGCGVPQVLKTLRVGHCYDISAPFIWMWLIGEVVMVFYSTVLRDTDWIIVGSYVLNLAVCIVLAWYKSFPRKDGA